VEFEEIHGGDSHRGGVGLTGRYAGYVRYVGDEMVVVTSCHEGRWGLSAQGLLSLPPLGPTVLEPNLKHELKQTKIS